MRSTLLIALLLVACAGDKDSSVSDDTASVVPGGDIGGPGGGGPGGGGDGGNGGGDGGGDGGGGDGGGGDGGNGGDSGSGSDTGTTGDTGGDSGGDGGGGADTNPCPAYSGAEEGRWWSWESSEAYERETGFTGGWESEVLAWSGDTTQASFEIRTVSSYVVTGIEDYVSESVVTYTCDGDGLTISAVDTSYSYAVSGTPYSGWSNTTYNPPWVSVPGGLQVGDRWSVDTTAEVVDHMGTETTYSYRADLEVVVEASRTVPAGTFTTLVVENTSDGYTSTYWTDADLGSIEVYSGVLVDYGG